jgi:hypothetical protein
LLTCVSTPWKCLLGDFWFRQSSNTCFIMWTIKSIFPSNPVPWIWSIPCPYIRLRTLAYMCLGRLECTTSSLKEHYFQHSKFSWILNSRNTLMRYSELIKWISNSPCLVDNLFGCLTSFLISVSCEPALTPSAETLETWECADIASIEAGLVGVLPVHQFAGIPSRLHFGNLVLFSWSDHIWWMAEVIWTYMMYSVLFCFLRLEDGRSI